MHGNIRSLCIKIVRQGKASGLTLAELHESIDEAEAMEFPPDYEHATRQAKAELAQAELEGARLAEELDVELSAELDQAELEGARPRHGEQ